MSNNNTFNHTHISKGLNNILERQQKGQLMFVDAMSRLVARDMIVGAETVDEPQVPFAKPDLIYALPAGFTKPSNGDKVLKGLCDAIIGFLEQKQQTLGASTVRKRPCLIIDDLNVLLSIGLPIGELYWMLERLRYWCSKVIMMTEISNV